MLGGIHDLNDLVLGWVSRLKGSYLNKGVLALIFSPQAQWEMN